MTTLLEPIALGNPTYSSTLTYWWSVIPVYTILFNPLSIGSEISACSVLMKTDFTFGACTSGNSNEYYNSKMRVNIASTTDFFEVYNKNFIHDTSYMYCLSCTNPSGTVISDTFQIQTKSDCSVFGTKPKWNNALSNPFDTHNFF